MALPGGKRAAWGVGLVVGFIAVALLIAPDEQPAPPRVSVEPIRPVSPRLAPSRPSTGTPSVLGQEFDCVIQPYQVVKLASPVVGVIDQLYVERGDSVRKGQILGKLQDAVETAQLALARAKAADEFNAGAIRAHLDFLRVRQNRAEQLASRSFVTKAVRDEALSDTQVAEQQLAGAKLSQRIAALEVRHTQSLIQQKTLRSPVDGVVTDILLRPGEYRNEQSPVMSLAQIDPLRVEVYVPTRFYGRIHPNMIGTVKPERPVGTAAPAKITIVDQVIDAASGTFGVRLLMPNPTHRIPAGLQCKVRFD